MKDPNGTLLLILAVALVAPLRFTKKVSSGSSVVSPLTFTVAGWVVTPGTKVSVPPAAA